MLALEIYYKLGIFSLMVWFITLAYPYMIALCFRQLSQEKISSALSMSIMLLIGLGVFSVVLSILPIENKQLKLIKDFAVMVSIPMSILWVGMPFAQYFNELKSIRWSSK